jgi:hypothetical protein
MPVLFPFAGSASLSVQFNDLNSTVVAMSKSGIWYQAPDAVIEEAGLQPGSYAAAILLGGEVIGACPFDWDGSVEVTPASRLVVGIPVTEIWNISESQISLDYTTTVLAVTSIAPDRSGTLQIQPGKHITIESDRIDDAQLDTYLTNSLVQVFRRNVPTRHE